MICKRFLFFGICFLFFGIWNLEFGIWNLEFDFIKCGTYRIT